MLTYTQTEKPGGGGGDGVTTADQQGGQDQHAWHRQTDRHAYIHTDRETGGRGVRERGGEGVTTADQQGGQDQHAWHRQTDG